MTAISKSVLLEIAKKINALNWHIVVYFVAPDLIELTPFLEPLDTINVVDHMWIPGVNKCLDHEDFQRFIKLMEDQQENITILHKNKM